MTARKPHARPLARLLDGRPVLVPRGGEAGERIARLLAEHGAEAVLVPLIQQEPPRDGEPLAAAVADLNRGAYDWVAVTSAHGAAALVAHGARPGTARVAAVGPATAAALTAAGFAVELVPAEFTGERLGEALVDTVRADVGPRGIGPRRVLLPLSEIAETTLEDALRAAGLSADRVTAYRTVPVEADAAADAALGDRIGAVLVLSSSGARALAARFAPLPPGTVVAAIGEPTASELARLGIPAAVVAREHTAEGAVAALVAHASHESQAAQAAHTQDHHTEGTAQ